MPLVVWSEEFSVGVKALDEQHTVLFDTINELHAAMMKGKAGTIIGDLLARLLTYTRDHFSDEERMMEIAGYVDLPQHRLLHRNLAKQVEDYIARLQNDDLLLSTDLVGFLSDWLKNHILAADQSYGPCMNLHGIR
jgi:hemerythrin